MYFEFHYIIFEIVLLKFFVSIELINLSFREFERIIILANLHE